MDDNLLHQIQKMYGFLELSERTDYNPLEFTYAFKDYDGNPTNTSIQADAHEFTNMLFDRLEQQLKGTRMKYLI